MRHHNYYVYIMSSLSRTLYAGVTNDLERRVGEHKEGKPGAFTARYNVNRLVYFEEFSDINQAIAREKEIKSMTRRQKIKLIENRSIRSGAIGARSDRRKPRNPEFLARQPRAGMTEVKNTVALTSQHYHSVPVPSHPTYG
jgi:putative endonuclease